MKLLTVVYSRMSSKRFPGKALCTVAGIPLVEHVVRSLSCLNKLGNVVVGTSDEDSDDELVAHCENVGLNYYRGDLVDVALRTEQIIDNYRPEFICRVCGDRPFLTPDFVRYAKKIFLDKCISHDIISNLNSRLDPPGLKIEFVRSSTFVQNFHNFNKEEREHITKYFYKENCFNQNKVFNFDFNTKNHSNVNLCIDTYEDLQRINLVLENISNHNKTYNHENVFHIIKDK